MRKSTVLGSALIIGVSGVLGLSSHSVAEMLGFARASADITVEGAANQLPVEVHDKKLDNELAQTQQELIDRQVQLTLSRHRLEDLNTEISKIRGSIEQRQRLLAEAYPVLESAVKENRAQIRFANREYSLAKFQSQIDDLLVQQSHEEQTLVMQSQGRERLEMSIAEAERSVEQMQNALETTKQEVAILRSRRSQAEVESQTLTLLAALRNGSQPGDSLVEKSLKTLKGGVERIEAENDARRGTSLTVDSTNGNDLTRGWSRLEALKKIHDKVAGS